MTYEVFAQMKAINTLDTKLTSHNTRQRDQLTVGDGKLHIDSLRLGKKNYVSMYFIWAECEI